MTDLFTYIRPYNGKPPFQAHSNTSRAASVSMRNKLGQLHVRVMEALRFHGPLTDEQLCDVLNLQGNTLRPRRRELQLMAYLTDTAKRRKTRSGRMAVVWGLVTCMPIRLSPTHPSGSE